MDDNRTRVPNREHLREQSRLLGVEATDEDLEAVTAFLEAILPALRDLEAQLPWSAAPADLATGDER